MQQSRHRLCSEIIKEHFGQTTEKIFKKLLNGRQTFNQLLQYTLINKNNTMEIDTHDINENDNTFVLTKSLKTMIQHHIIKHYYNEDDDIIYYEADIDSVEFRLHFPEYIHLIKQYENKYNNSLQFNLEYIHLLILFLCQHGQCTKQQLFDLYAKKVYDHIENIQITQNDSNNSNNNSKNDILTDNNDKYSFSLQFNQNNDQFGEWTRMFLTLHNQIEQKKIALRNHFLMIFKWLINTKCFVIQQKKYLNENISKKRKMPFSDTNHNQKMRKLDSNVKCQMELDNKQNGENDEFKENDGTDPIFILCHRSFLHEIRNKLIIDFVLSRYDSNFCDITDIILKNSLNELLTMHSETLNPLWLNTLKREEQRESWNISNILDFNNHSPVENRYSIGKQKNNNLEEHYNLPFLISKSNILEKINNKNNKNNNMNIDELDEYLTVLSDGNLLLNELNDILPILILEGEDKYHVNISGIIDYIQLLDVQKLVHSRFDTIQIEQNEENKENNNNNNNITTIQSNDASRIFGAIISMRKIGDKQLSEICMIKHSTVKKVLYRMLADKFVEMEYIARSADRDPKKSFFVWTINWYNLHTKILKSMYMGITNLMLKKLNIRKTIEKMENDNSHKNNQENNIKWRKYCSAFEHLTLSIQKLNKQIALHRDF